MAERRCEECGTIIPNGATACPNCGCPIENTTVCKECESPVFPSEDVCSNCDCPVEKTIITTNEQNKSVDNHQGKRTLLLSLVTSIVLCLVVVGIYIVFSPTNKSSHYDNLSVEELLDKAKSGDVRAMNELGKKAIDKSDFDRAEKWFRKAAERDYTNAIHNMGVLYSRKGEFDNAIKWFVRSANKRDADSAYNLGLIYTYKGNDNEANKWFIKAHDLRKGFTYERILQIDLLIVAIIILLWPCVWQSRNYKAIGNKKYSVAIPLIVGIVAYIVLSVIASNILQDKRFMDAETSISNDVLFCGIITIAVSWIITRSHLERLIYLFVVIFIHGISESNWEKLGYGTAVIVFLTDLCIIAIASLKRNNPLFLKSYAIKYLEWSFRAVPLMIILPFTIRFLNLVRISTIVSDCLQWQDYISLLAGIATLFLCFVVVYRACKKHIRDTKKREKVFWYMVGLISLFVFMLLLIPLVQS